MTTEYVLDPIDPTAANKLRANGGIRYVADSVPGYPCRQCLRDADIGEALILVSHDPFTTDSPYRSASPIFLHEAPCAPPANLHELPDQLTVRQLSVRAFDGNTLIRDAAVIDGIDLDTQLRRFFDDSDTSFVEIHNASRGCWATTVQRQFSH
jgi:hypothetical protein